MLRRAGIVIVLLAVVIAGSVATSVRARNSNDPLIYLPIVYDCPAFFCDDFSNPGSGWPTTPVTDPSGTVVATRGYTNGTYQLLFQQGNYLALAGHNLFTADFQVAADVWPAASTDGTIGLYFDNSSTTGLYDFEVGLGGYYLARYSYTTGQWTTLVPFGASGAILGGTQVNHVKVLRQGAAISLYANNQLLTQVTDSTYPTGFVGLAASANTAPFDARFDNFALYALSSTPTSGTVRGTQAIGKDSDAPIRKR